MLACQLMQSSCMNDFLHGCTVWMDPPKHPCTADTCVVRYALFLRAANAPYPFMGTGSMFALHHVYTVMVLDVHYFGVRYKVLVVM